MIVTRAGGVLLGCGGRTGFLCFGFLILYPPWPAMFLGGLTVQRFFLSIMVIECGDPLHTHKTMILPPPVKEHV